MVTVGPILSNCLIRFYFLELKDVNDSECRRSHLSFDIVCSESIKYHI